MPKNPALEYSAAEPAFLRRLKAGNTELDGRHNVQIPRARGNAGRGGRLDMGGEEGDDDPVMLDESGNVVTKGELEAREEEKQSIGKEDEAVREVEDDEAKKETQAAEDRPRAKTAEGGVSSGFARKRKAVKVVGDADGDQATMKDADEEVRNGSLKSLQASTKDLEDVVAQQKDDAKKEVADSNMKKGKKKKIKLSFDEPE